MPDITMCKGDGCLAAGECYRFLAKPKSEWQSYFAVVPYDDKHGCDHFWPIEDAPEPIQMELEAVAPLRKYRGRDGASD